MPGSSILYAFYGDDFTGSTDALQQLGSHGVPSALFLRPPTARDLAAFPEARAIGIAGESRSRGPEWMDENLPGIFERMRSFGAPVNQYKVCSTFDSSPSAGCIGRAIELGMQVFGGDAPAPTLVPIVVAAPHLRRYVAFGHLFAAEPGGGVVRIDRHPMSRHPVTPMRESDLRRHLGRQTALPVGLVDLTELQPGAPAPSLRGRGVTLFDGVDAATQARAGELIWMQARESPLFSASSSGLTAALIAAWRKEGLLPPDPPVRTAPAPASPLLALSGSCSVATERQIRQALDRGFFGIRIEPSQLLDASSAGAGRILQAASEALRSGLSTVLYTALGAPSGQACGSALGSALGDLLLQLLSVRRVPRVVLCGGDTCSHAVQRLDADALTWASDLCSGAPVCRTHSGDPRLDGLELVLKGGQLGGDDLLLRARDGAAAP